MYIESLRREIDRSLSGVMERTSKYFQEFKQNLDSGIDYYRTLAQEFSQLKREDLMRELERLLDELKAVNLPWDDADVQGTALAGNQQGL